MDTEREKRSLGPFMSAAETREVALYDNDITAMKARIHRLQRLRITVLNRVRKRANREKETS